MSNKDPILQGVLTHVNKWPDKPCRINLETLEKAPPKFSMSMQQLAGTVVTRQYIDGSFVGAWPFAMYIRFSGVDTGKRLNAVGLLSSFKDWLCNESGLPNIGDNRTAVSFEMTSLPAIASQYDDGGADYQAVFRLNYKQRSV